MLATHVLRGAKAGLVAGLAFGLLVALVANPLVGFAESVGHETGAHDDAGHGEEADLLSTTVTNAVSVLSSVLWGLLLGSVVFGAGYYFLEPAIPGTGAVKSVLLAAAGFLTVSGTPWLVLPPQPPGAESALAPDTRLLLYGGMMGLGAAACLLAAAAYHRLHDPHGRVTAVAVALVPLAFLSVPAVLAPSAATSSHLPGPLAAGIRGLVVLGQVGLWGLLAATHAWLCARTDASSGYPRPPETASERPATSE